MTSSPPATSPPAVELTPEEVRRQTILSHERRNLFCLAAHYLVHRVSWIAKTESVIMPAFLDLIAGAAWLRGFLPILNRLGHSVPALLFSDDLRRAPRKSRVLTATSTLMGVPFLILAATWAAVSDAPPPWMPSLFLILYFAFFCLTGLNQLAFGTVQGKLIRPNRRGRLMGIAGTFGSIPSILCAWFLLRVWLTEPGGGFEYIFGFTGIGFVLSGALTMTIIEPRDPKEPRPKHRPQHLRDAWEPVRTDASFRKLMLVTVLFVTGQLLFPHYQALGREHAGGQNSDLMIWVIAQNAGVGLFSFIAGVIADRFGNRLVLKLELFSVAMCPLLSLALSEWIPGGDRWYWLAFFLLGLTPVTYRSLENYTLEISDEPRHPRYLSTLKLAMAVPLFLSPLLGLFIDVAGFTPVFVLVGSLMFCSGLMTFRLREPRFEILDRNAG